MKSQQWYHKKYSGTGFLVGSPLTSCRYVHKSMDHNKAWHYQQQSMEIHKISSQRQADQNPGTSHTLWDVIYY